jgi:maleate isomerase
LATDSLTGRFSSYLPRRKLGVLLPLPVVENLPYEFYRIVPDVLLVMVPGSVGEFSVTDMERVLTAFDDDVDKLMQRHVDMIVQAGVPLATLIGIEAHDHMVARIERRSGRPAVSQVSSIVSAARHLGLRSIATANKWTGSMNDVLARFFAREGVTLAGVSSNPLQPAQFTRLSSSDSLDMALALGRQALKEYREADGLYLGGGTWLSEPVAVALEEEFGKPVITNLQATIWDVCHRLGCWTAIEGHGRLLASA